MPRFDERRQRARRLTRQSGADALLVTNFINVTYLTGFTGDDSYLLLLPDGEVLISDPRYSTQLAEECPGIDVMIRPPGTGMVEAVGHAVAKAKIGKLAVEASSMTVALHEELQANIKQLTSIPTSGLIESLREVKDKDEVAAIREAVRTAEKTFAVIRASLRPEQTEKQVADELEHQLRLFGAQRASFPPIVAVGPRSALPHARPTEGKIGEAPFVLIDWGACQGSYMSDLTRVLVTAKIPPKLHRIYGVVLKAQIKAIAAIRPGVSAHEVDAVARGIIADAGFGRYFGHGLGHGIGLEIHEGPRLAKNQHKPLKPGNVVTVEPGIYLPGFGGVRIEDDVLVTRRGHEVLTSVAKQWDEALVD